MNRPYLFCLVMLGLAYLLPGQDLDLLIKNGHVLDPKNNIDGIMDVGVKGGKITEVARSISKTAKKTIDATGLYVTPGLIDIHGHHFFGTKSNAYLSNSYTALPPDGFTLRTGVTAVVDAGGSGWRNYEDFKNQTIGHSKTKVYAFLNIVGAGMSGGAYEQNLADMDAKLTAMTARSNKDRIVGIKLAHYGSRDWTPALRAAEAGRLADIPVMIDFGGCDPPLSLDTLLNHVLRPGDIFTHCYAQVAGRESVVKDGKVMPWALKAQQRGIIMDVGHGGGSFVYAQAIPAIQQGLKPNTISTDLHTGSMNAGMKDMAMTMSKLINIGMSMKEIVEASTWKPAQVIKKTELGHLSAGAAADIALLKIEKGNFGYYDVRQKKMPGDKRIVCEMTILDGEVVWDLNALSFTE
ncbi:MAG TPA: amidohydrolase/deacetylase family metallohydrolase [Saprospiraceae bacterium]|nr:amidohydrolase/deacetylase family metallohydrolase [Saprospiraceae bacterium]